MHLHRLSRPQNWFINWVTIHRAPRGLQTPRSSPLKPHTATRGLEMQSSRQGQALLAGERARLARSQQPSRLLQLSWLLELRQGQLMGRSMCQR